MDGQRVAAVYRPKTAQWLAQPQSDDTIRFPRKRERGEMQEEESPEGRTAFCLPSGPWRTGTRRWFCVSQKPFLSLKPTQKTLTEVNNDGLLAVDLERRVEEIEEMSGRVRRWPALIGGGRGRRRATLDALERAS